MRITVGYGDPARGQAVTACKFKFLDPPPTQRVAVW